MRIRIRIQQLKLMRIHADPGSGYGSGSETLLTSCDLVIVYLFMGKLWHIVDLFVASYASMCDFFRVGFFLASKQGPNIYKDIEL
jgi:hypothetical protein